MSTLLNTIDALLITNPTNIRYLTGFVGVAPEEREGYVLVTKDQIFLFTNALYMEEARKLTNQLINKSSNQLIIIEISRENPFAKKLKEVLDSSRTLKLNFEENDLTVAELGKLKKELNGITLVPTQNKIEKLRMIKRDDEIADIRAAAKLTDQCFDYILGKLKPGITEAEIAWGIESYVKKNGASLSFSPIVAFGKNSSMPHYQPADSCKLVADSLILLDFGARVNGYASDMTRVVFLGKPKDEWKRAYKTVLEAQTWALDYLASRPGLEREGDAVDTSVRDIIERAGFPTYPHSLGHGVGLDIHEAPRLTIKSNQSLKPRMVITIEPGIYVEGQYGIRIEDLVLLKKDGIKLLSKSPKNIIVL